ncbi:MAG: hypothetical protein ACI8ZM_003061 [Crocinitomix sp.]
MKLVVLTYCITASLFLFGQKQKYYNQIERTECDQIEVRAAGTVELEVLDFDQQNYSGMLMEELNLKRKTRGRPGFELDSTFNRICNTGVKHFSRSIFSNRKNQRRLIRYTEFGIRYLRGDHRLFKAYSFYFNLTHLHNYTKFFYAAGDETTKLKLFVGKRPRTMSPTHEDYEEPIPVKPITEKEFGASIIQALLRDDGAVEFFSKNYSHIGVSMRIDEYSINRRKIPRAYIMIIIGGKQTQKIRAPYVIPQNSADDNSPYTILK